MLTAATAEHLSARGARQGCHVHLTGPNAALRHDSVSLLVFHRDSKNIPLPHASGGFLPSRAPQE